MRINTASILALCLSSIALLSAVVCEAQEVIFVDDFNSPAAQPVRSSLPSMAQNPVGKSTASKLRPGAISHRGLTRQQAAQQFSAQAQAKMDAEKKSGNPVTRTFKKMFGWSKPKDITKQQQPAFSQPRAPQSNPQSRLLQAGYSTPKQDAKRRRSGSPKTNGGIPIRTGDQRVGLFDKLGSSGGQMKQPPRRTVSQQPRGQQMARPTTSPQNLAGQKPREPQQQAPVFVSDRNDLAGGQPVNRPSQTPVPVAPSNTQDSARTFALRGAAAVPPRAPEPAKGDAVFVSDNGSSAAKTGSMNQSRSEPRPIVVHSGPAMGSAKSPFGKQLHKPAPPAPLVVENTLPAEPVEASSNPGPLRRMPVEQAEPKQQPGAVIALAPEPNAPRGAARPTAIKPGRQGMATRPHSQQLPKAQPAAVVLPNPVVVADQKPVDPSPRAAMLLAEAHRLAQTAQAEGDYTRVVQQCRHVLAIDDSPLAVQYCNDLASWAMNKRGEAKADEGREQEALADFAEAVRLNQSCWRAIHNRGVMMAQKGLFAEAFEAFNKTIELNPDYAKAYSNRASLYIQSGDYELALADYKRAISIDPDLVIAHKGRGRVCHVMGDLRQALLHFEAAVLLDPADPTVVTCRADLLMDMGYYPQAAAGYRQAIKLDPQHANAYRNLAWLHATCPVASYRDGKQALEHATKAIDLCGDKDDICLDTLAAAQAASGDFDSAVETIKQAIALAPAGDQSEYQGRLELYQASKPFHFAPAGVRQTGFTE